MIEDKHDGDGNEDSNEVPNQAVSEIGLGGVSDCLFQKFICFSTLLGLH